MAASPSNPRLRFPESQIVRYADRYEYAGDDEIIALRPAVVKRGCLISDELFQVARWKAPRNQNRVLQNSEDDVEEITRFSLHQVISIVHHLPKGALIKKISLADAVIIPSYNEGFCYTAAESVALGKPIISSHQGALPEVVSGKFLALPQLDSNSLAEAMQMAIHGQWSQSEVRHFHLADTVDQYISLYDSLKEKVS